MLQINVAGLLKGPVGTERVLSVDDRIDITGYGPSRVEGEVKLIRTNRSILAQGRLHTSLDTSCARCLETYSCPLVLNIEEEYFPITDVQSGIPLPGPDEPDSFTIDEHLTLDLTEAVRQYALMAVPMKPLCRVDCPGIPISYKTG